MISLQPKQTLDTREPFKSFGLWGGGGGGGGGGWRAIKQANDIHDLIAFFLCSDFLGVVFGCGLLPFPNILIMTSHMLMFQPIICAEDGWAGSHS